MAFCALSEAKGMDIKMRKKDRILQMANIWRIIPAWVMVVTAKNKELILDEMDYWNQRAQFYEDGRFDSFSRLIVGLKEYRNLLIYRLSGGANLLSRYYFLLWKRCILM